ncbi:MAG: GNAT family N-acetyltransferase [Nocardioidaceae bacterium]
MKIREFTDRDTEPVLALNAESVWALSPLNEASLRGHLISADQAMICEVDGVVAAFALAYAPGSPYASINYAWHAARFDDFLYLDRIAVGVGFRRRGIATVLYDKLEATAKPRGRMVCEISSDPPNPASLAFHLARGYREIGHLTQLDGHQTVMMEKTLSVERAPR